MASGSISPSVLEIVELRAHGLDIPILFPVDVNGFASVTAFQLSVRFSLQENSIWIEREIYDCESSLLLHTLRESSLVAENRSLLWCLIVGKYKVYRLPDSQIGISTEIHTPLRSSTCTFRTPPMVRVKTEPSINTTIVLFDSTDEDKFLDPSPLQKPSPSLDISPFVTSSPSRPDRLSPQRPSSVVPTSILQFLCKLASMLGRKNILKKLDYNKLKILEVSYLPPRFDGD